MRAASVSTTSPQNTLHMKPQVLTQREKRARRAKWRMIKSGSMFLVSLCFPSPHFTLKQSHRSQYLLRAWSNLSTSGQVTFCNGGTSTAAEGKNRSGEKKCQNWWWLALKPNNSKFNPELWQSGNNIILTGTKKRKKKKKGTKAFADTNSQSFPETQETKYKQIN